MVLVTIFFILLTCLCCLSFPSSISARYPFLKLSDWRSSVPDMNHTDHHLRDMHTNHHTHVPITSVYITSVFNLYIIVIYTFLTNQCLETLQLRLEHTAPDNSVLFSVSESSVLMCLFCVHLITYILPLIKQ